MKRIKRITTAFQRYRRSRGFGIHSPFAFHFVLRVLKERAPYYCYARLRDRRRATVRLVARESSRWPVMSLQNAKMIVRVAAFFNPGRVLVLGAHYGLGTAAILDSGSTITAVVWEGPRCFHDVFVRLTADNESRIDLCRTMASALEHYDLQPDQPFFMLVNDVAGSSADEQTAAVAACVAAGGTALVRHIDDDPAMAAFWQLMSDSMPAGMTFTNGKIGIAVMRPGLPRQNFLLWF